MPPIGIKYSNRIIKNAIGTDNIPCQSGAVGDEGPRGAKGKVGLTGPTGPKGPTGPAGPLPAGQIGPTGESGQILVGQTGPTGPTGQSIDGWIFNEHITTAGATSTVVNISWDIGKFGATGDTTIDRAFKISNSNVLFAGNGTKNGRPSTNEKFNQFSWIKMRVKNSPFRVGWIPMYWHAPDSPEPDHMRIFRDVVGASISGDGNIVALARLGNQIEFYNLQDTTVAQSPYTDSDNILTQWWPGDISPTKYSKRYSYGNTLSLDQSGTYIAVASPKWNNIGHAVKLEYSILGGSASFDKQIPYPDDQRHTSIQLCKSYAVDINNNGTIIVMGQETTDTDGAGIDTGDVVVAFSNVNGSEKAITINVTDRSVVINVLSLTILDLSSTTLAIASKDVTDNARVDLFKFESDSWKKITKFALPQQQCERIPLSMSLSSDKTKSRLAIGINNIVYIIKDIQSANIQTTPDITILQPSFPSAPDTNSIFDTIPLSSEVISLSLKNDIIAIGTTGYTYIYKFTSSSSSSSSVLIKTIAMVGEQITLTSTGKDLMVYNGAEKTASIYRLYPTSWSNIISSRLSGNGQLLACAIALDTLPTSDSDTVNTINIYKLINDIWTFKYTLYNNTLDMWWNRTSNPTHTDYDVSTLVLSDDGDVLIVGNPNWTDAANKATDKKGRLYISNNTLTQSLLTIPSLVYFSGGNRVSGNSSLAISKNGLAIVAGAYMYGLTTKSPATTDSGAVFSIVNTVQSVIKGNDAQLFGRLFSNHTTLMADWESTLKNGFTNADIKSGGTAIAPPTTITTDVRVYDDLDIMKNDTTPTRTGGTVLPSATELSNFKFIAVKDATDSWVQLKAIAIPNLYFGLAVSILIRDGINYKMAVASRVDSGTITRVDLFNYDSSATQWNILQFIQIRLTVAHDINNSSTALSFWESAYNRERLAIGIDHIVHIIKDISSTPNIGIDYTSQTALTDNDYYYKITLQDGETILSLSSVYEGSSKTDKIVIGTETKTHVYELKANTIVWSLVGMIGMVGNQVTVASNGNIMIYDRRANTTSIYTSNHLNPLFGIISYDSALIYDDSLLRSHDTNLVLWLDSTDVSNDGNFKDKSSNPTTIISHPEDGTKASVQNNIMTYESTTTTKQYHSWTEITNMKTVFWVIYVTNTFKNMKLLGHTDQTAPHLNSITDSFLDNSFSGTMKINGKSNTYSSTSSTFPGSLGVGPTWTDINGPSNIAIISLTITSTHNIKSTHFNKENEGGAALAELLIYDTILSPGQIDKIENYLATKWRYLDNSN